MHDKKSLSNYHLKIARKLIRDQRFSEAIESLSEAIDVNPDNEHAIYERAQITFLVFHEYEEALNDLSRVIKINKRFYLAYLSKGQILSNIGMFQQALENYATAIRYNKNSGIPFYLMGQLFEKVKGYSESLSCYNKALEIEPNNATFHYAKGLVNTTLGEYHSAIASYDRALCLNFENYEIFYEKSLALYLLNQYKESLKLINKAIEIDPDRPESYTLRGNINLNFSQDIDNIIDDYTKSICIDPNYYNAYICRGVAYFTKGNYEKSLNDIHQSEIVNKEFDQEFTKICSFNKGRIYYELGDLNRALIEFSRAIEIEENCLHYYYRALCLSKLENYKDSIKDYSSAIELLSESDWFANEIYFERALAYEKIKNLDNAISDYHQILITDPGNIEARCSLEKIQESRYISSNISINRILENYVPKLDIIISRKTREIEIKNICENRKINYLFHFTKKSNLMSILKEGLLSRELLDNNQYAYQSNDYKRLDNERSAICLSIGFPQYKMFYKYSKENQSDWVILLLSPSIIWSLNCAFCHDNAASNTVKNIPIEERKTPNALRRLFDLKPTRDGNIPTYYPSNPQSEVLVFDSIPPLFIEKIHFCNESSYKEDIEKFKDYENLIEVNDQYFKPRQDYKKWQV